MRLSTKLLKFTKKVAKIVTLRSKESIVSAHESLSAFPGDPARRVLIPVSQFDVESNCVIASSSWHLQCSPWPCWVSRPVSAAGVGVRGSYILGLSGLIGYVCVVGEDSTTGSSPSSNSISNSSCSSSSAAIASRTAVSAALLGI